MTQPAGRNVSYELTSYCVKSLSVGTEGAQPVDVHGRAVQPASQRLQDGRGAQRYHRAAPPVAQVIVL